MKFIIEAVESLILLILSGFITFAITGGQGYIIGELILTPIIALFLVITYFSVLKKNWPTTNKLTLLDWGTFIFGGFLIILMALFLRYR